MRLPGSPWHMLALLVFFRTGRQRAATRYGSGDFLLTIYWPNRRTAHHILRDDLCDPKSENRRSPGMNVAHSTQATDNTRVIRILLQKSRPPQSALSDSADIRRGRRMVDSPLDSRDSASDSDHGAVSRIHVSESSRFHHAPAIFSRSIRAETGAMFSQATAARRPASAGISHQGPQAHLISRLFPPDMPPFAPGRPAPGRDFPPGADTRPDSDAKCHKVPAAVPETKNARPGDGPRALKILKV